MAKNQICSHRRKLDDRIIGMEGVQFFVSCITEIEQNVARRISPGEDEGGCNPEKIVYPGFSFFIAYRETSNKNSQQRKPTWVRRCGDKKIGASCQGS